MSRAFACGVKLEQKIALVLIRSSRHVRFALQSGRKSDIAPSLLSAKRRLHQVLRERVSETDQPEQNISQ
jgi:hypothetical protein